MVSEVKTHLEDLAFPLLLLIALVAVRALLARVRLDLLRLHILYISTHISDDSLQSLVLLCQQLKLGRICRLLGR